MTKFLVDENLLGLLRRLRMMGYDSTSMQGASDRDIQTSAEQERRIILTRDRKFFEKLPAEDVYYVKSELPKEQLREVLKQFPLQDEVPLSRCFECNAPIRSVEKETVRDKVDAKTFNLYVDFYECPSCQKIYWEGSHFQKMQREIESLIDPSL
ncbi:DUF5615 family PIN-like protein [Bdellovibrio sp. HCB2-146]|uniref:DUF5615 family PIN-like protein n=1 Tax=Bdellovibrio sp. HCB2-146 TaxID=3394362 RepID=UPI0039BD7276